MNAGNIISCQEFCSFHKIESSFLINLQEYGLIEIQSVEGEDYIDNDILDDVERMLRLHYELEINMPGIEAIGHMLKRVDELQNKMQILENRLREYEDFSEL